MNQYKPPNEDIAFVLEHVLECGKQWQAMPAFSDIDLDLAKEVLQQAGRFAEDILAPINSSGDLQGCQWHPDTQSITTPTGFAEAWQQFVAGAWPSLACDPEFGGQGLPQLINAAVFEMLSGANDAWVMYSGVLHGAYEALVHNGTPALREQFLEKIVSGEWLATMALTEPQAGSDLALLRCKAEPLSGSSSVKNGEQVRVTGGKIFISGGDQDMTENIVHLVLARLPDAPQGTKGLSLVMVPKLLPDGSKNSVYCDGIEKKMGLKGSATCQMRFEQAVGWLVGEPHAGLAAMFLMMNAARLHIGVKAVGHMEAARQKAYAYALDRRQSKAPKRPGDAAAEGPDVIAHHPAIRHKLWKLSAQTQAARVLSLWAMSLLDQQQHDEDPKQKQQHAQLVALLTPIVKGFLSDTAFFSCDEALGVFGGYGYIHEYAIEQHLRDVRVTRLYEGSNEIQAIDLALRKLLGKNSGLPQLIAELENTSANCAELAATQQDKAYANLLNLASECVRQHIGYIQQGMETLSQAQQADPEGVFRVADSLLQAMGHTLFTWAWAKIAIATAQLPASSFREQQQQLARYGLQWLSPAASHHWQQLQNWQQTLPWVSA